MYSFVFEFCLNSFARCVVCIIGFLVNCFELDFSVVLLICLCVGVRGLAFCFSDCYLCMLCL